MRAREPFARPSLDGPSQRFGPNLPQPLPHGRARPADANHAGRQATLYSWAQGHRGCFGSAGGDAAFRRILDRKSTRLNSSHVAISYAVFCLKKKKNKTRSEKTTKEYTKRPDHYNVSVIMSCRNN